MPLTRLDHVNVRTANLAAMTAWYEDVLGMISGPRPDFAFPGAWLYVGDTAAVHLVGVQEPTAADATQIEHFAFSATGMRDLMERLDAKRVPYTLDPVPGFPVVQINLHDFDGNHIHIDFAAEEAEGLV